MIPEMIVSLLLFFFSHFRVLSEKMFEAKAYEMGFSHAAVGAMVRSSYHADQQAHSAQKSLAEKT